MFEAIVLLILLLLILWFMLAKEQKGSAQRSHFIDLTAELKPPAKKQVKDAFHKESTSKVYFKGLIFQKELSLRKNALSKP